MAKDLKGISITLDMDLTGFNKAMRSAKNYTNQLQQDLNNLNKALKFDPTNTETLNAKIKLLNQYLLETVQQINYFRNAQAQAQGDASKWALATEGLAEMTAKYKNLTKELQLTEQALRSPTGYQSVTKEIDNIGKSAENTSTKTIALGTFLGNIASEALIGSLKLLANSFEAIAKGIYEVYKVGVDYNKEIESYSTSIRAILDDDEEATQRIVDNMKSISRQSSFDVSSLLEATQQLVASGISADEASDAITNLSKSLAYAGKGSDELKRMAQNMNQIKNAGKATALDLKQFAYAGVPIYKLLADYSEKYANGVDTKNMEVSYEDIAGALAKASGEGGKFFDAFTIQAGTMQGQLNRLTSNFKELAGTISLDTSSALTNSFLPVVNEAIRKTIEWQENGFSSLGEAAAQGILDVANVVVEKAPELLESGKQIVTSIGEGLLEKDENGKTKLENAVQQLTEGLLEFVGDPEFLQLLLNIGKAIGAGIVNGIKAKVNEWFEAFDIKFKEKYGENATFVTGGVKSGGFGSNSLGYGAIKSGGFMSGGVTLNASFSITNGSDINETTVKAWARVMADQINEELGGRI